MKRTEQVETLTGRGVLQLSDRYAPVDYVIRVSQEFDGDLPTQKSAQGGVKLPSANGALGNTAAEVMARKFVELKLQDGRKAQVLFTETDGTFQVRAWPIQ